jgi:hypothetical protein
MIKNNYIYTLLITLTMLLSIDLEWKCSICFCFLKEINSDERQDKRQIVRVVHKTTDSKEKVKLVNTSNSLDKGIHLFCFKCIQK